MSQLTKFLCFALAGGTAGQVDGKLDGHTDHYNAISFVNLMPFISN